MSPRNLDPVHPSDAVAAGKKVGSNGFALLMQDHRDVLYQLACYGGANAKVRAYIERKIILDLLVHMQMEEQILYPAASKVAGEALAKGSYEDHATVRQLLEELDMAAEEEKPVLIAEIRQALEEHIRIEEGELFPLLRRSGMDGLELGMALGMVRLQTFSDLTGKALPDRWM